MSEYSGNTAKSTMVLGCAVGGVLLKLCCWDCAVGAGCGGCVVMVMFCFMLCFVYVILCYVVVHVVFVVVFVMCGFCLFVYCCIYVVFVCFVLCCL